MSICLSLAMNGCRQAAVAEKSEIPAPNQRLIYRGQVLSDEKTLTDYGFQDGAPGQCSAIDPTLCLPTSCQHQLNMHALMNCFELDKHQLSGHTMHLVRGAAPATTSSAPTPPAPAAAPAATSPVPGFGGLGTMNGLGGLGGLGAFGGLGDFGGMPGMAAGGDMAGMQQQMAQQMMANPEMMQQMLNSPMMQNILSNPEILQQMIAANPQLQQLMESNPEIGHVLRDPATI
eukprot:SAG31_NODE_8599_length_1423_cov_0.858761_1_plen_230_part_10